MSLDTPAVTSARLAALFPPGVVAAELRGRADPASLLPEETLSNKATGKRAEEFAAGRLCARLALAELGITGFPVRVNPDRSPRWPNGVVGSITHTAGFCGAVVARRDCLDAIGLDVETVANVTREIWPQVCTPGEATWLRSLPPAVQPGQAALLFSAKEAFYKCQYGVTGEWLDFHDVAIEHRDADLRDGGFAALLPHKSGPWGGANTPIPGRFRFDQDFVMTGIALPSRSPASRGL